MSEEMLEQIKEYLKDNLRLDVKTDSVYNGGMNEGPMYNNYHSIQLILDDEVISEVTLS